MGDLGVDWKGIFLRRPYNLHIKVLPARRPRVHGQDADGGNVSLQGGWCGIVNAGSPPGLRPGPLGAAGLSAPLATAL